MKRPWVLLGLLVVLAFVVRLALVPTTGGIDWDGPGYMQEAERLGDVVAGRFPSYCGARAPQIYPLGLPVLLRVFGVVLGTRDAGVAFSLAAGTALVPLAFLLVRGLGGGDGAALLAASWTCLDPGLVERSHTLQSESVFAALLWAGMVPLLAEKLVGRRIALGGALIVAASTVRSIGLPLGALAASTLALRGEKRAAAILAVSLLAAGGFQHWVETRNGACPYWKTLAQLALAQEHEYPGYFDVDEAGTTLRQAVDGTGPTTIVLEKPAVAARILGASTLAAGRALLPFVLAVPFAVTRRSLLLVAALLVGALVPLALLQHEEHMARMLVSFRPALFALAAAGLAKLAGRLDLKLSNEAATLVVMACGLGSMLAFAPPTLGGLAKLGAHDSPRARADAAAARIAALVPAGERILRGPGGDRTLIALAGRCDVYSPNVPGKIRAFCAGNGIRFVLHDGSFAFEPVFAPARLATEPVGEGQLLARVGAP